MANVYVGFHDQRNSSRILKPPGGGTSNIFGNDLIPDVVPKSSPRDNAKYKNSSIQEVLQTQNVTTTVTTREEKSSTTTNGKIEENNVNKIESNGEVIPSKPDVAAQVTCQVEQLKIVESSTKSEVTETDASGNSKVIASDSKSDGSVEHNSSFKKGTSIGDILNQEDIMEKKKIKGSPSQRVPPGGYSSGLW